MSTERYDPMDSCAPVVSDGIRTIGHIDGAAASWSGNMTDPEPNQDVIFHREGGQFHDGNVLYHVYGGVWVSDEERERMEVELP